jgi:hypothetical protein
VGVAALTSPLSAALGSSCRRLATAGNEAPAILRAEEVRNDETLVELIAAAA